MFSLQNSGYLLKGWLTNYRDWEAHSVLIRKLYSAKVHCITISKFENYEPLCNIQKTDFSEGQSKYIYSIFRTDFFCFKFEVLVGYTHKNNFWLKVYKMRIHWIYILYMWNNLLLDVHVWITKTIKYNKTNIKLKTRKEINVYYL